MDKKLRVVAIVQARMGSSRLPGKILLDIDGSPMLERVVERVQRAKTVHEVVVATTVNPEDDAVMQFCEGRGYAFVRGDHDDVLDRHLMAARIFDADIIVRITDD